MGQVRRQRRDGAFEGTILVIDDDDVVRTVIARMLERFGFRALTAADGAAGVNTFREHGPIVQVVLLDMTMPNMDGVETCHALRELDPEVKVILSSGYAHQDVLSQLPALAVAGYIQKPYSADELLAVVQGVISA